MYNFPSLVPASVAVHCDFSAPMKNNSAKLTEDHLLPMDLFSIAVHLNHRYQVCLPDGSVQVRLWRSQQLCAVHTRTEAPAALLIAVQPKALSILGQD